MSRQLTIAWAKRKCPDPRVVKDVALRLDEAAAAGGHLLLIVGKRLTRSRTPYLVISHQRKMFAFELTSRQAKNLEAHPNALGALVRRRLDEVEATAPDDPAVMLTNLVIDGADTLNPAAPMTGHLEYQSSLPHTDGVAVRLTYDMPDGVTVSHFDHGLLQDAGLTRSAPQCERDSRITSSRADDLTTSHLWALHRPASCERCKAKCGQ